MVPVKCELSELVDRFPKEAEWPTEMAVRPLKGDRVESKCGNNTLQVLSVTHTTLIVPDKESCWDGRKEVPGLKVHLGR